MADREARITQGLGDVQGSLSRLNQLMERQEHLEKVVVPREEHGRRRRQTIVISLLIVFLALVVEHATITRCFLTPTQTGWQAGTCSALFPGYSAAREQSEANLRKFSELIGEVPVNKARIKQLERDVADLKE